MKTSTTRVGVIGTGLMGSGIVEICARKGCEVISYEISRTRSTPAAIASRSR